MSSHQPGIGLFGGSFDPVHNGHVAIAESFLKSEYISELWILLTPDPPHKPQVLTDYEVRFEMLRAAFKQKKNIHVSDVENQLSRPSYTIQTLKYLNEKYPEKKFFLCIGEDSIRDFKEWENWKEILDYCELLVAQRPTGEQIKPGRMIAAKTHYVSHQPVEISSTEIRKRISRDKSISELVPPAVDEIIREQELYKKG